MITALAKGFQVLGDEHYLAHAIRAGGYIFTTGEDRSIISRKKELTDGAEPAGSSVAALNLLQLYHLTGNESLRERSTRIFSLLRPYIERYPSAVAVGIQALSFYHAP